MAKIHHMVGRKVINGFKGVLDFYYYMDVACVRKWPRSQGNSQTPASVAQWPTFSYVARLWSSLSPFYQEGYNRLASECGLHKRDWYTRGYLSGIYKYPLDE